MADPQITIEWLNKADEDNDFASSIIDDSVFYAQICFHFHQAAEKYFKAFIVANEM
jgi:HEPN domain-containing protein